MTASALRRSPACTHSENRRRRLVLTASVVAAVSMMNASSNCVLAFSGYSPIGSKKISVPPSMDSHYRESRTCVWMSSDKNNKNNSNNKNNKNNKNNYENRNLSNSERGRREEDRRRKERKDDVVIGKTSAKKGAKDYPIDPEATEREYLRQASREEQLVHKYTDDGMEALKSLRLEIADQNFSNVFDIRPNAYVWLAGIVKFYLNDLESAASIFAKSTNHFETKFGPMGMGPASEERIWRNASELKYIQSLKRPEKKRYLRDKAEGNPTGIAQIEEPDVDIGTETRKVHRLASELFEASVAQRKAAEAIARAKLLSFAGTDEDATNKNNSNRTLKSLDIKKRKLYACYFLALHYDVTGDIEESKKWIKKAFKLSSNSMGKSSDILDTLPLLHMTARDWFDDDPYDDEIDEDIIDSSFDIEVDQDPVTDEPLEQLSNSNMRTAAKTPTDRETNSNPHMSDAYSDPILEASIMEDVEKMKFDEIREALRIRGISVTGSKETLKERLFISLMDDAGFQSGFAP